MKRHFLGSWDRPQVKRPKVDRRMDRDDLKYTLLLIIGAPIAVFGSMRVVEMLFDWITR